MANTFPKKALAAFVPSSSFQSLMEREWLEGATQTFPAGAPLKLVSGLLLEFVNPTDGLIAAFSIGAASGTTGGLVRVLPATAEVEIEANFLASAAADNVLAAADWGVSAGRDLLSSATLLPSAPQAGWYIADAAADPSVRIFDFKSDHVIPNVLTTRPAAGDTNARVRARVIPAKSLWQ